MSCDCPYCENKRNPKPKFDFDKFIVKADNILAGSKENHDPGDENDPQRDSTSRN